jgi:hypothetical protein
MAEYYTVRKERSATALNVPGPPVVVTATSTETVYISDYDRQREGLLLNDLDEGWASELRRYLGIVERDVVKDTDLVEWWQVSYSFIYTSLLAINSF